MEALNRTVGQGISKRLGRTSGKWVDELPNVLWSYRTTVHTTTKEMPFRLTYGVEALLPVEIGLPTYRILKYSLEDNKERELMEKDLLQERREKAALQS